MKTMKLISLAVLTTVTMGLFSGCVVENRPWRHHYYSRPVVVVPVR